MRTALVTGASSGIGAACAVRLARSGWWVLRVCAGPAMSVGRDARARAGFELLPGRMRDSVHERVLLR